MRKIKQIRMTQDHRVVYDRELFSLIPGDILNVNLVISADWLKGDITASDAYSLLRQGVAEEVSD